MKFRMFISLLLALALLCVSASAQSLFDDIPGASGNVVIAPSYGTMSGAEPAGTATNTSGGTILTYSDVTPQDVNDFGVYLGDLGYKVTGKESQGSQIAYALSNGSIEFTMIYDSAASEMKLSYPAGTDYEKPLFPGYKRLRVGEEINVSGLGRFTFKNIHVNELIGVFFSFLINYRNEMSDSSYDFYPLWIDFSYYNTNNQTMNFTSSGENNLLSKIQLHYINTDNQYTYDSNKMGRYFSQYEAICTAPGEQLVLSAFTDYKAFPIDALTSAELGVAFGKPLDFNNPLVLPETSNAILAVTIDFKTGDKYVIMLRGDKSPLY